MAKQIIKKPKAVDPGRLLSILLPFVQLLAGLEFGWVSAHQLYGKLPSYEVGIPAFLVSALLFIFLCPPQVKALSFKSKDKLQPLPKDFPKPPRVGAGIVVLLVLGQFCFLKQWVFAACGFSLLALGLAAWLKWNLGFSGAGPSKFSLPENKVLWGILFLVAVLDFSRIGDSPTGLTVDESNNLLDASGVAMGSSHGFEVGPFTTGWGGTATFPDFIVGGAFKLFGFHVWSARIVSILSCLAALWFFYHWCRFYFGALSSAIATFLMAACWWFLYFSLAVWHTSLIFLFQTMAYYFLEKGFRDGKRMDFWWAGLCAAGCVMNYVPGRSVPLIMAATVLGYGLLKGSAFWKTYWKPLALALLGFLLFLGPFMLWAHNNPGEVFGRIQLSWLSETAKVRGGYFYLIPIYFWSLIAFWTFTPNLEFHFTYGANFIGPLAAGLFVLGFGLCFFQWKKRITWVLLPGIFWGISANALGIQYVNPPSNYWHPFRTCVAIPFLFLGAAWGLEWLFRFQETFISKKRPLWLVPLVALGLLFAVVQNIPAILGWHNDARADWANLGRAHMQEAEILNACYPECHLLVRGDIVSNVVSFQTLGKCSFKQIGDPVLPLPYKVNRDVMIFFADSDSAADAMAKVKKAYPNGVWKEYPDPFGEKWLISVRISKADVEASQKNLKNLEPLD